VWGLERGYCLMIGGEAEVVKRLDPIFASLAPGRGEIPRTPGREKIGGTAEQGYLHCGPSGAGHFVKMVHNGIEYGLMAAYAEGLGVLHRADVGKHQHEQDAETAPLQDAKYYQYDIDLSAVTELWHRRVNLRSQEVAQRLEPDFVGLGWEPQWFVLMAHRRPPDRAPDAAVRHEQLQITPSE